MISLSNGSLEHLLQRIIPTSMNEPPSTQRKEYICFVKKSPFTRIHFDAPVKLQTMTEDAPECTRCVQRERRYELIQRAKEEKYLKLPKVACHLCTQQLTSLPSSTETCKSSDDPSSTLSNSVVNDNTNDKQFIKQRRRYSTGNLDKCLDINGHALECIERSFVGDLTEQHRQKRPSHQQLRLDSDLLKERLTQLRLSVKCKRIHDSGGRRVNRRAYGDPFPITSTEIYPFSEAKSWAHGASKPLTPIEKARLVNELTYQELQDIAFTMLEGRKEELDSPDCPPPSRRVSLENTPPDVVSHEREKQRFSRRRSKKLNKRCQLIGDEEEDEQAVELLLVLRCFLKMSTSEEPLKRVLKAMEMFLCGDSSIVDNFVQRYHNKDGIGAHSLKTNNILREIVLELLHEFEKNPIKSIHALMSQFLAKLRVVNQKLKNIFDSDLNVKDSRYLLKSGFTKSEIENLEESVDCHLGSEVVSRAKNRKVKKDVKKPIEPLPDLLRNHVLPHTEEIWNRIQFVGRMNAATSLDNTLSREQEQTRNGDISSDSSSVDDEINKRGLNNDIHRRNSLTNFGSRQNDRMDTERFKNYYPITDDKETEEEFYVEELVENHHPMTVESFENMENEEDLFDALSTISLQHVQVDEVESPEVFEDSVILQQQEENSDKIKRDKSRLKPPRLNLVKIKQLANKARQRAKATKEKTQSEIERPKHTEERPHDKRLKRRGKEANILLSGQMKIKVDSSKSRDHSSPSWLTDVDLESLERSKRVEAYFQMNPKLYEEIVESLLKQSTSLYGGVTGKVDRRAAQGIVPDEY
ncbi:uncharacterized protein [Clytia hemisphaerica]|uniref:uncharacterized protein n=1 Tax=Clytia hemisphaerica TaxID=252671 RepID=UPI0034D6E8C3